MFFLPIDIICNLSYDKICLGTVDIFGFHFESSIMSCLRRIFSAVGLLCQLISKTLFITFSCILLMLFPIYKYKIWYCGWSTRLCYHVKKSVEPKSLSCWRYNSYYTPTILTSLCSFLQGVAVALPIYLS